MIPLPVSTTFFPTYPHTGTRRGALLALLHSNQPPREGERHCAAIGRDGSAQPALRTQPTPPARTGAHRRRSGCAVTAACCVPCCFLPPKSAVCYVAVCLCCPSGAPFFPLTCAFARPPHHQSIGSRRRNAAAWNDGTTARSDRARHHGRYCKRGKRVEQDSPSIVDRKLSASARTSGRDAFVVIPMTARYARTHARTHALAVRLEVGAEEAAAEGELSSRRGVGTWFLVNHPRSGLASPR